MFWKIDHLEGSTLSLVRSVDSIDGIWQRLKSAYGSASQEEIIRDQQD